MEPVTNTEPPKEKKCCKKDSCKRDRTEKDPSAVKQTPSVPVNFSTNPVKDKI